MIVINYKLKITITKLKLKKYKFRVWDYTHFKDEFNNFLFQKNSDHLISVIAHVQFR